MPRVDARAVAHEDLATRAADPLAFFGLVTHRVAALRVDEEHRRERRRAERLQVDFAHRQVFLLERRRAAVGFVERRATVAAIGLRQEDVDPAHRVMTPDRVHHAVEFLVDDVADALHQIEAERAGRRRDVGLVIRVERALHAEVVVPIGAVVDQGRDAVRGFFVGGVVDIGHGGIRRLDDVIVLGPRGVGRGVGRDGQSVRRTRRHSYDARANGAVGRIDCRQIHPDFDVAVPEVGAGNAAGRIEDQ